MLKITTILLCALLIPVLSFAKDLTLTVETITCEEPRVDLTDKKLTIPDSLGHIKEKLEDIHFKTFNLESAQSVTLPMKEKKKLTLNNGDALELEVLYFEDQRVGLWINWNDSSGMQLLDTRMHFDASETMLAGAECEENKGKMLAVKVSSEAAVAVEVESSK